MHTSTEKQRKVVFCHFLLIRSGSSWLVFCRTPLWYPHRPPDARDHLIHRCECIRSPTSYHSKCTKPDWHKKTFRHCSKSGQLSNHPYMPDQYKMLSFQDFSREAVTCSVSVKATTAGVTRSPASFATTSALSSYKTYHTNNTQWLHHQFITVLSFTITAFNDSHYQHRNMALIK